MLVRRFALSFVLLGASVALAAGCVAAQEPSAPSGGAPDGDGGVAPALSTAPTPPGPPSLDAGAGACPDREQVLAASRSTFDARRSAVQAKLTAGITASNWSTVATSDTWGPHPTTFAAMAAPASCTDASAWQRELVLASVNYWVEQDLNYCHHHIPGWTPPHEGKFRNSTGGSTSGGSTDAMTCTPNRFADGHQRVTVGSAQHTCSAVDAPYCDSPAELDSPDPAKLVQWRGFDCSDFTSWVFNFAGVTAAPLPTGIGTQACTLSQAPGALLDINAVNFETAQSDGQTLQDKLRPGDLLYVLKAATPDVAHVVTWTGLRWKDLRASAAASAYDVSKVGQPSSRLGGDVEGHGLSLAQLEAKNPYMIVDSHYAGPGYRPFYGWYRQSVTHVRRIIDAASAAQDPVLAPYRIQADANAAPVTREHGGQSVEYAVLVAPKYAALPAGEGHRLLVSESANSCARDGAFAAESR